MLILFLVSQSILRNVFKIGIMNKYHVNLFNVISQLYSIELSFIHARKQMYHTRIYRMMYNKYAVFAQHSISLMCD